MANYVKFKQGLKKDFNTTNQPLTNGMIYFVIDENNHGSIYYDTIVDGAKATKQGTIHRVKFSGLPIKITGSVTGTGAISADGESITINTVTNHSHGLAHMNFNVTLSDNDTDLNWTRLGNQNSEGFWLKSVRGQSKAPAWFQPDFSAGIAFGGADTKGIISLRYQNPSVRFAGGNGSAPVWYFTITGAKNATYDLTKIGGHSSDAAKLDHNIVFKIDSVADATKGGNGVTTNLSGNEVKLILPASISGFSLLQATRFQGNADTATTAAKLGRSGNVANPMTFNWSGKDGQPTWIWGGEDGTNMYVYKPSNFKVAHATSAAGLDHDITIKIDPIADTTKGGNGVTTKLTEAALSLILPASLSGFNLIQSTRFQGNADTATVAAKLGNGGNTGDPMIFNWSGQGGQPTWIWGGNSKTNMYVYNPSNFKVSHAVSATGLDHNVTFKISKVANNTTGEAGVTTKLDKTESINLILPGNLSGFDNIQSTRFQGTADNADKVDNFHVDEEKYKYAVEKKQPTSGAEWCIKISTADWNNQSETIYLIATGNNARGVVILKTGSRQNNWWGYATNYNGTGISGVYKVISNSDDVYVKVGANYTSVVVRTTFNPKDISIPSTIPSYKYTSVPSNGGFFSNSIYTDNLTFTTPKYWANIQVSDSSNTGTKPTFNTAYTSNWWRSTGETGWWNETHAGGITMEDNTYVKVAGNKSFLIPNGSLKIGGNGNILFATGNNDATFKIYGQTNTTYGTETIAIQTCFDNQDPQTSGYTTQYANRCNLLLQPKGGQVYIGKDLTTAGDTGYKLLVNGNQWINGNLVFNGAREIKFTGSKNTYSMIRFVDNTSDAYGNGISIGGGGSVVIGAGESAMSYTTSGGDERLFLLSDGVINIEAGGDTIANRVGLQITGGGHVIPIKTENNNSNAQDLGTAGDYWRTLYVGNITLQSQTGNRLVWTNANKGLQAGNHWAEADRVAINTTTRPGQNFYVNGSSMFTGYTYINRNYIIQNSSGGTGDVVLNVLGFKASGYPLYNDPEFANTVNSVSVYNNSGNGTVTHARVDDATCGNSSGKVLKITHTGTASPGWGGFYQNISSRANAIFIQIFRAKIPTGRNLATASNSMGDSYKDEWLTPVAGTGKWEWYARRVICGAGGSFSTGGHIYIKDGATPTTSAPLVWYLSYCNVIDVTKGNYDGLRTRYSDYVTYDSGEDGKTNKTPINDKYVAKIVTKTSNGSTFTLRGLNGAGNELTDAVLTIPNAASGKAGLITDTNQTIYGEKTLTNNLRFANVTTGVRGIVGTIADNDCWRVVGRAESTNAGYLEIATGDDTNEPIYVRQYSGTFGTVSRTFTLLDGSGRSRAPELFEAKKIHVNSGLNQGAAIADIGYQFQVTGTSNFTSTVDISGVTNHHNNIQIDSSYSISRPAKSSNWYGAHNNAMIRMTSVNGWAPLLAQRATNGYWVLGHYDNGGAFNDQWIFGYLANANLEGTSGAKNDLSTKYRMRNVGGEKNIVFSTYDAQIGSSVKPVYIKSNGEAVACSYSINSTIDSGTANRMAYYKGANEIAAAGHYVSSNQVGINATSVDGAYVFYVGGSSYFNNSVTINGNVHVVPDTDVGLNQAGSFIIGAKNGQNMGIDGNEIMARNNSAASTLYLNNEGGTVQVGKSGITIQAQASSTNLQSGGLRISSESAGNSGNVALELYRGGNGSWQIANEGAILYFRSNWVNEKKSTYAKNTLIIDHTTGSASIPYLAVGQEARNTTYGLYVVSNQSWIKNTLWTGNVYPDANNSRACGTNNYYWNTVATNWLNTNRGSSGTDGGITLYNNEAQYGIMFRTTANQGTHGYVSGDWATYFTMSNSANRGWVFKRWGVGNVASISTDGNAYFNGHIRAASAASTWIDGQRYNNGGYNLLDASDSGSYWPWLRQTNTNTKKWFSLGILNTSFYLIGSGSSRTENSFDFGWQFDISNGNVTFNTGGNKSSTAKTVINGRLIVNPYYSTEQSYSEGIRVNKAQNGWANVILGGDNGSSTGTETHTWLIGCRGSNGSNTGIGGSNGQNLTGAINDLTIEVNGSSGQGLTLPATQGQLPSWQQRPIMAQLPAQGASTSILNNMNYKSAYLATTSDGKTSMGLAVANWYHVMNFRHLDDNGYNAQLVLPLSHNSQTAWRWANGKTAWSAWNYIFDDHHAMVPASNNAYNIGSTSNYWATGYINTLYVNGNAYANGSKRIPTTGNNTGTVGSATLPVYSNNGVLTTITSYQGNAATATNADKLDGLHSDQFILADKRGSDFDLNRSNYWAGMSTKTGINSNWWHVLSMDWSGNDTSNWVSQLALPTQQGGVPRYRRNNSGGTAITSSTWHSFITDENISSQSVNYAKNAGNADTVDGYHAADLFAGGYKTTVDLSSLDNSLYYPITGTSLPSGGYHRIKVSVQLNSGTKPSWATHSSGFTTNVVLYATAYGWGATQGETIVTNDSYQFTNCGQVVGFTQNGYNSTPVLWLKGGGKYFVECDYNATWTTRTSLTYTYGDANSTYKQTVQPQSAYPGFKSGNGGDVNGVIRAGKVYGAVWNDYAEYRQTKKYIQPGHCVIETGKGDLIKSSERLQPGANIVSDTFGFAIGETEQTKTPLAVSGRVLAYPYEDRKSYQAGDPVCSGPNGTISKMTREEVREYPDRIIGTVSEIPDYEVWGSGNVKVNGRIWIKVK